MNLRNIFPIILCALLTLSAESYSAEFKVNNYTQGDQLDSSVAYNSAFNEYMIVWQSIGQNGQPSGIYGRRFVGHDPNGTPIPSYDPNVGYYTTNGFQINQYTYDTQFDPSVVYNRTTNQYLVTWMLNPSSYPINPNDIPSWLPQNYIQGRLYYGDGYPLNNQYEIAYTNSSSANSFAVAPNNNNNNNNQYLVTYEQYNYYNGTYDVNYRLIYGGGGQAGYGGNITGQPFNQESPAVAYNSANNSYLVAFESDYLSKSDPYLRQSGKDIWVKRVASYGDPNIGGDYIIHSPYNTYSQTDPSIAYNSTNNQFLVAWTSDGGQDGAGQGIYGQLLHGYGYDLGSPEFKINTYTAGNQSNSSVVYNSVNNQYLVTWESDGQDGSGSGIYGQLFNSSGGQVSNEFQINTYTQGNQKFASVAYNSLNNQYIFSWTSDGQDGSGSGVYADIISAATPTQAWTNINSARLVFGKYWSASLVSRLENVYTSSQHSSYTPTNDTDIWNYSNVNYNQNGYWGLAKNTGNAWIDKYGYKHISLDSNGKGLTTYNQTEKWGYLAKLGYSQEFGESFNENWNKSSVDSLYGVYSSGNGSASANGKTWYFTDKNYTVNGAWGVGQSLGNAWIDKYGYKYMSMDNGKGLTTYNQSNEWGYLAKLGYSQEFGESFNQNWDKNEVDSLYNLFDAANGSLLIDGTTWYFNNVNYAEDGAWGFAKSIGDAWIDKYGFLHMYLANGKGLTTYATDTDWEYSALAKAGYSGEFGDELGMDWSKEEVEELYELYLSRSGSIEIDGETWYYTGENFIGRSYGDYWVENGNKYIYLGSGLTTKAPVVPLTPIPEPLTVVSVAFAIVGLFIKKKK